MARCESGTILGREISFDASLPLVTGQYKGNRNLDWSDEDSAGHIVPLAGMGQQNPTRGIDFRSYFTTIPHDKLIILSKQRVVDGSMLGLIKQSLTVGIA
jgi:hypothetical protein